MDNAVKNLEDYRKAVEFLAKNKVDNLILNAGNDHAKIIFQNIFVNCEKRIRLLAGNLQNEVTKDADYISSLKHFLQVKDSKLEVLLDGFDRFKKTSEVEVFRVLWSYKDKVTLKSTDAKFYVTKQNRDSTKEKVRVHFCTGDAGMYRLETNTQTRAAHCNFNDRVFVETLNNLFDKAAEKGTDITWDELI
jgi:ribosomal protein L33